MNDIVQLFAINASIVELVVRGTAIYLLLLVLLRFVVPRELGAVGMLDLMVLVLVADAAQNAMTRESTSITEGAIVLSVIAGWELVLDRLAHRQARDVGTRRRAGPV